MGAKITMNVVQFQHDKYVINLGDYKILEKRIIFIQYLQDQYIGNCDQ